MPRLLNFTGCCTARILAGFGGTETGDYAYRPQNNRMLPGELLEYLNKQLPFWKRAGDIAIIFATTNSDQKFAEAELKAFGFVPTKVVGKAQHPRQNLTGWHYVVGNDLGNNVVAPYDAKAVADEAPKKEIIPFAVGTRVKILPGAFTEEEVYEIGYDRDEMEDLPGSIAVVSSIYKEEGHILHYRLRMGDGGIYFYPHRLLKLATPARDAYGRFVKA